MDLNFSEYIMILCCNKLNNKNYVQHWVLQIHVLVLYMMKTILWLPYIKFLNKEAPSCVYVKESHSIAKAVACTISHVPRLRVELHVCAGVT